MKALELIETEKLFHCSLCDGRRWFRQVQIYLAYALIISIVCGVAHAILIYSGKSESYFFVTIGVISAMFLSFMANDTKTDDARLYEYKLKKVAWSDIKFKFLYVSIDALVFLTVGYFLYSSVILNLPCEITQVKTFIYINDLKDATWLLLAPVIGIIIRNTDKTFFCISIVNTCGNHMLSAFSYYVMMMILSEFVKIDFLKKTLLYPVCKLISFL